MYIVKYSALVHMTKDARAYWMYIVKYSALVHMAETHSQARASFVIWTRAEYFTIYIQ